MPEHLAALTARPNDEGPAGIGEEPGWAQTYGPMSWRRATILMLIAPGAAMTVAWGWRAGIVYGFFLAVALAQTAFVVLWGRVGERCGGWYYDRQLRGNR